VYGVNLPMYKTVNFALSASLGSLAGLMWCMDKGFVAGQDFTFLLAVDLIIGLVIGGVGTLQGSIFGGLFVVWVRDLTKRISIPLGFYTLDGDGPLSAAIFGLILILFTFFAPGGISSMVTSIQKKIIQVVPLTPAGEPITPLADLDPGSSSTRATWALRFAVAGPVLLIIGWVLMNIDSLLVGTLAFALRFVIVVLAPVIIFVAMNELRAVKAGLRGENADAVSSQAKTAGVLGVLSFAYIQAFALNLALRAHHVGHLARESIAVNPDGKTIPAIPMVSEAAKAKDFSGSAGEFCETSPSGEISDMSVAELCNVASDAIDASETPVGFWLIGWPTQSVLSMVLSIIVIVATIVIGLRYFVFADEKTETAPAPAPEEVDASS